MHKILSTFFFLGCWVSAQALTFTEIARFDISTTATSGASQFIGSNPSTLAWTGNRLFVGGFNNSAGVLDVGIVEVLGADAMGFVDAPTFARVTDFVGTPTGRGIVSMDVSPEGESLAVAYDDGTGNTPGGFSVFNTSDYGLRWFDNQRGSSGAAFDPGFNGLDSGTAFGAFGSGRRILYDTDSGVNVYDRSSGMAWFESGGTLVRDMDFDPFTGDIYVRHNNHVSSAARVDGNQVVPNGILTTVEQADLIGFQNLSFLGDVPEGDAIIIEIIFNDRTSGANNQVFEDVIRIVDHVGSEFEPSFRFLDDVRPELGNAAYDFDYDAATQTLAISDFANRNVHIFEVGSISGFGDFDGSGVYDCLDVDALVGEIVDGSTIGQFDLTGDGIVDLSDLDAWLAEAGSLQLPSGNPYLKGDANLDGVVDVSDFSIWNSSKFTNVAAWCSGDFTADGVVDVSDFAAWNSNKFTASDVASVPEPAGLVMASLALLTMFARKRR